MTWVVRFFTSSIGKKQGMALSGLLLCGFLVAHLSGNFLLIAGRDEFNRYAAGLKTFPVLLYTAEVLLLALFVVHIGLAVAVSVGNRRARPSRYVVQSSRGERTFASYHMLLTGMVVLVFLLVHLWNFRLADLEGTTLYDVVAAHFAGIGYVIYYVFSSLVLGIHLWHGVQSAFKSLGLEHAKYTPAVRALGKVFAVAMAVGYSSLPIWLYLGAGIEGSP